MNVLDLLSLKGKVAIVTGGYSNLGHAMTEALAEAGARVYVFGRNEQSFSARHFDATRVSFVKGDIVDTASIKACYEKIFAAEGHIDILVNNATDVDGGGCVPEKISDEMWRNTADGVLKGTFACIREIIPYMEKRGGKIINIASMYGVVSPDLRMYEGECSAYLNPVHYGAMKAGVIQMTRYFGVYLIGKGINVNSITPGTYPSPEIQKNKEFVRRLSDKNPAHRIGQPDDLKGAVLLLASSASDYIVGQNIIVDGGWTIW